jgi:hypothetical protein
VAVAILFSYFVGICPFAEDMVNSKGNKERQWITAEQNRRTVWLTAPPEDVTGMSIKIDPSPHR